MHPARLILRIEGVDALPSGGDREGKHSPAHDHILITVCQLAKRYSVCCNRCLDCLCKIVRVKAEWTGFALV
jgi:hypothetical protein